MRWIPASIKPMARPANPTGAFMSVAPGIVTTRIKVITVSQVNAAAKP